MENIYIYLPKIRVKHRLLFITSLGIILFCISSCNDLNQEPNLDFEISKMTVSFNDLNKIIHHNNNIVQGSENNRKLEFDESDLINIYRPLIESGKNIFQFLSLNSNHLQLDSEMILSLNQMKFRDEQYAEIGFLFAVLNNVDEFEKNRKLASTSNSNHRLKTDIHDVMTCLGAALGLQLVEELYLNTLSIGATAEVLTAKQAVKLLTKLGSRYLGYLGLAYAVYEFVECYGVIEEAIQ